MDYTWYIMKGYKGVVLKNGILRSKYQDIFEINIPREYQEVDEGIGFSECGYSFCGTIEDVVCHENFICSYQQRKLRDVRLFEIDTLDGKVIGESYHFKTSKIKLIREVTKEEIVKYFKDNTLARDKMIDHITSREMDSSVYEEYCLDRYEGYRLIEEVEEIEDLYVRSCYRLYQDNLCQQKSSRNLKLAECNGCNGFEMLLGPKACEADYLYLLARRKLKGGLPLIEIEEYVTLVEKRCKNEVDGLRLLNDYFTECK